jgi:cell pole-organizing protein PopZ
VIKVTTEPKEQHEPSMEEILSSIRRIIADEETEEGTGDDEELGAAEAQAEALNDDADALAQAAEEDESEDVLELTRVVRETGEVVDLKAEGAAMAESAAEPGGESEPVHQPQSYDVSKEVELAPAADEPAPTIQNQPKQEKTAVEMKSAASKGELLSATAASAASGAFAKLSQAFQRTPAEDSVADDSGRTVEQFIEDMIRPLLKEWLDENLPPIVDRLVEKEIHKIARRAELM